MRLPSSVKCLAAGLVVFFMGSALAAAQPSGDGASADAVSERQSMDAYTSLEDGQPSPSGALEL